jgi:hypothetical protein
MNLIYPLSEKGTRTSSFGFRTHPIKGTRTPHNGIDIGVSDGTIVNAVADGVVVRSDMKDYDGYGNFIIIKHDENGEVIYSAYAHLLKRMVDVGDEVTQGEQIGLSGGGQGLKNGGGLSTGPHLHFEIRKDISGNWVDPDLYLNDDNIVKGEEQPKSVGNALEDLLVSYDGLTGKSKEIVDTVISNLKSKKIINPYTIVVISTILMEKYESELKEGNVFSQIDEDLNLLTKDIQLSDNTTISKEKIKMGTTKFKIGTPSKKINPIDVEAFLKALSKIPEMGAKLRKEKGYVNENAKLIEEINEIKNFMKKII